MPLKAKICHLTSVHPPFDTRIFHKECKSLAMAGYDVTLIVQHDKDETVDGIKIVALPTVKNRFLRMLGLTSKAFLLSLRQKADIYHFHDPELLPVGLLLKLISKKKVIYDVHEDYAKQIISKPYIPRSTRNIVAFLVKMMEYLSSNIFDGIVTATDDISNNFTRHKRTISVKNYPVLSYFSSINRKCVNNESSFTLVYIGGICEIRGIAQIVQALGLINSSRQVKLILCGKFYPTAFETRVRNLKGFEKVDYLGWIKTENIPEVLSKADAGVVCLTPISNYLTALPVKLFEYMAAGLPVIASNFPLWREIVESNRCGICVNPLRPEDITNAIRYIMENPDEAQAMGENGRNAVLKKYNWENEGKKFLELYEKVLQ